MSPADYDSDSTLARLQAHDMASGVAAFQRMFRLPETGELDDATLTLMEYPRCSMRDVERPEDIARRRKRYVLQGNRRDRDACFMESTRP